MKKFLKIIGGIFGVLVVLGIIGSLIGGGGGSSDSNQTAAKSVQQKTSTPKVKLVDGLNPSQLSMMKSALNSFGDWDISSDKQYFSQRWSEVEQDLNSGNTYDAYETAKQTASKADQWFSQVGAQWNNLPKYTPSDVKHAFSDVDFNIQSALNAEQSAFNDLATAINKNDMSKVDDAKNNLGAADSLYSDALKGITKGDKILGVNPSSN